MPTLKESARDYVPKKTLNISDLDRVDLSFPVEDKTGTKIVEKDGQDVEEEYSYKAMVVNEQEYRISGAVFEQIQKMIKLKPDLAFVKVTSTGSGLKTRYSVDPLD